MHLRIADFVIHVSSSDPRLPLHASPGSLRFLVDPRPADVSVGVALGNPHQAGQHPCLFDSGGAWQLRRLDDGLLFVCFSSLFGSTPYKTARVSRAGTEVDVRMNSRYFDGSRPIDPLEYPLDELIVINLLASRPGLEIHGCGVVDADGAGYLFVGQSGAGKSTIARLWLNEAGAIVLSDDRVIVRRHDGAFWMHGTPWHGEAPLASPAKARLSGVFLLRQDVTHDFREISRASAAARLFAASFPSFYDASALTRSLEFLDTLTTAVRCGELGFAPAPSLLDFVRGVAQVRRLQN